MSKAKTICARDLAALAGDRYEGVITDMDGTILDSMGMWEDIDRRFLEKRGKVCDTAYTSALKTMTLPQAARFTVERYGLQEEPEDIIDEWYRMAMASYGDAVILKPGAMELLKTWNRKEIPLMLCSMSPQLIVDTAVRQCGMEGLFRGLVYMETTGTGKDKPDPFLYASHLLGLSPERTLVLEDSVVAMKTAVAAGYPVCAVYDPSAEKDLQEIMETADFYLPDFS
ncbi:MAG: HAD family phosphatase [Lachnospiraceae bacterium]|nr:HAD family phosphatase [Lachnospiraceae bacterium]